MIEECFTIKEEECELSTFIVINAKSMITEKMTEKEEECQEKIKKNEILDLHCDECNSFFGSDLAFATHTIKHSKDNKYFCHLCYQKYSNENNLKIHMGWHEKFKIFICDICGKAFAKKNDAAEHKNFHLNEKPFKCKHCSKSFMFSWHVGYHEHFHHLKATIRRAFHECLICNSRYPTKYALNIHTKAKHNVENIIYCEICNKNFENNLEFGLHSIEHNDEKKYFCHICSNTYINKDSFRIHIRAHELSKTKSYQCDLCGKFFKASVKFNEHKRYGGCIEGTFKCTICNINFETQLKLVYHKKQKHIRRHIRRAKKIIKVSLCEICGHIANSVRQYTLHKLKHSSFKPFTCSWCSKSFVKKTYLVNHERTHSGEKPFTCGVCKKSFAQRYALTVHKRIHTGEKPFKCSVCTQTFSVSQSLRSHRKSCNGILRKRKPKTTKEKNNTEIKIDGDEKDAKKATSKKK